MMVRATDKDEGSNGTVKFRLKDDTIEPRDFPSEQFYPYFSIDSSGAIRTKGIFDREKVDRYSLQVIAYDLGIPNAESGEITRCITCIYLMWCNFSDCFIFIAMATVNIFIGDQNDNRPRFLSSLYERTVSELTGPFSFILKVEAEDADSDDTLAYSLDPQAVKDFSIDNEGNIFLRDQVGVWYINTRLHMNSR